MVNSPGQLAALALLRDIEGSASGDVFETPGEDVAASNTNAPPANVIELNSSSDDEGDFPEETLGNKVKREPPTESEGESINAQAANSASAFSPGNLDNLPAGSGSVLNNVETAGASTFSSGNDVPATNEYDIGDVVKFKSEYPDDFSLPSPGSNTVVKTGRITKTFNVPGGSTNYNIDLQYGDKTKPDYGQVEQKHIIEKVDATTPLTKRAERTNKDQKRWLYHFNLAQKSSNEAAHTPTAPVEQVVQFNPGQKTISTATQKAPKSKDSRLIAKRKNAVSANAESRVKSIVNTAFKQRSGDFKQRLVDVANPEVFIKYFGLEIWEDFKKGGNKAFTDLQRRQLSTRKILNDEQQLQNAQKALQAARIKKKEAEQRRKAAEEEERRAVEAEKAAEQAMSIFD